MRAKSSMAHLWPISFSSDMLRMLSLPVWHSVPFVKTNPFKLLTCLSFCHESWDFWPNNRSSLNLLFILQLILRPALNWITIYCWLYTPGMAILKPSTFDGVKVESLKLCSFLAWLDQKALNHASFRLHSL